MGCTGATVPTYPQICRNSPALTSTGVTHTFTVSYGGDLSALDAVGAPVRRLVRTAVGPIRLIGLAPGEFRPLRPDEIRTLYKAAGL